MKFLAMHPDFILPTRGTKNSAGYDLYMPEAGMANGTPKLIKLGFATQIPVGYVGLLLPRSSTGVKYGLEVNNTVGVIDSDYQGEWMASVKTKSGIPYSWEKGDRLFQAVFVAHLMTKPELVTELEATERAAGGFGSTGR